jgi:phospholipid/cholesterol/gamma-HCH transport system substrate-binding protein
VSNSFVETLIGAVVLAVAGAFLAFAYSSTGFSTGQGYEVSATFNRIDGIADGTDVRIAGIKVGTVTGLSLDPQTYMAKVKLNINEGVKLPDDSQIKVASEGLLGNSYLAIEPGGDEAYLKPGGEIQYTQGTVDLMGLISKAIFSIGSGKSGGSGGESAPSNGPSLPAP